MTSVQAGEICNRAIRRAKGRETKGEVLSLTRLITFFTLKGGKLFQAAVFGISIWLETIPSNRVENQCQEIESPIIVN